MNFTVERYHRAIRRSYSSEVENELVMMSPEKWGNITGWILIGGDIWKMIEALC